MDEKLSVLTNPLDDTCPGARAFDDEGTPCRALPLVSKGILKNLYTDQLYAEKLGIDPTGHGYKFGPVGDLISFKPSPASSIYRLNREIKVLMS